MVLAMTLYFVPAPERIFTGDTVILTIEEASYTFVVTVVTFSDLLCSVWDAVVVVEVLSVGSVLWVFLVPS